MPRSTKNVQLTCLVISDGRRGIENQALGLAEALAHLRDTEITKHIISSSKLFKALPPRMQFELKPNPIGYGIQGVPKIAIGCGRQAIAPLMALQNVAGAGVFTVYVQDPRIDSKHFDLVIAPEHDALMGVNIVPMIGSPNRITSERLDTEIQKFAHQLGKLSKPRITVLIGGTSKSHNLTHAIHQEHMKAVCILLEQGMSVMLTTSRRTPDWAVTNCRKITKDHKTIWVWDSQRKGMGDNPYFAFLGGADAILVTEDSTNMLTEACTTGKPVFTLPMSGKFRAGKAGKFVALYKALEKRCHVIPFSGSIEAPCYKPLRETRRMAEILLQHLGEN